jgi:hypothetical protein
VRRRLARRRRKPHLCAGSAVDPGVATGPAVQARAR